jgi:hypothetical protein
MSDHVVALVIDHRICEFISQLKEFVSDGPPLSNDMLDEMGMSDAMVKFAAGTKRRALLGEPSGPLRSRFK